MFDLKVNSTKSINGLFYAIIPIIEVLVSLSAV